MTKQFIILSIIALILLSLVVLFRSEAGAAALWSFSKQGTLLLPLVAVSAILDSINPCAFSILLLTIAFLFSIGKQRKEILRIGGIYIFGIFLVYIFIGLGILQTLHVFNTPNFMGKVGAILMIVLGGINILDHFFPKFPIQLKIPSVAHKQIAKYMHQATLPAAFLLGVFVGLCEFPCTGGPYLMILGLLHDQTTYWNGVSYLLFYNIIFVSPLLVILLLAGEEGIVTKIKKWKSKKLNKSKFIGGLLMIAIGLIIFSL